MTKEPFINNDFKEAVESHIFGNLLIKDTYSPLILGIFGPPGEGKTFQLEQVCRSLDIQQTIISPGELESPNAGHPAFLLRQGYLEAGSIRPDCATLKPAVLVINDIDTVLGNWGELVQYTVNRQTLYGQLMAFCDKPNLVSKMATKRVPIIITGNNPSILYQPLLRAGRMRILSWIPTVKDKLLIVSRIFTGIPETQLKCLIKKYPGQPVSFWSDINARFREDQLNMWLKSQEKSVLLRLLQSRQEKEWTGKEATFDDVKKIAHTLSIVDIRQKSFVR